MPTTTYSVSVTGLYGLNDLSISGSGWTFGSKVGDTISGTYDPSQASDPNDATTFTLTIARSAYPTNRGGFNKVLSGGTCKDKDGNALVTTGSGIQYLYFPVTCTLTGNFSITLEDDY